MWRSVLLHEFPDHQVETLHGLPGRLAPNSLVLEPSAGIVLIAPGRSLHYVLDTPLTEVVGVSCRLRFERPGLAVSSSVPILRLGNAVELSLEPLTTYQALVRVQVHRKYHDLGQLPNASTHFVELRLDWHTNGKTYLRADGRLIGYHDAFSRGSRLTIEDVTFGRPGSVPTATDARFQLGEFFIRALNRRTYWPRRNAQPAVTA
ncbi:hypothetical protein ACWGID_08285 [Kribbella sp. NPDC054772]